MAKILLQTNMSPVRSQTASTLNRVASGGGLEHPACRVALPIAYILNSPHET
jgi:hypothetical protein